MPRMIHVTFHDGSPDAVILSTDHHARRATDIVQEFIGPLHQIANIAEHRFAVVAAPGETWPTGEWPLALPVDVPLTAT